MTSPLEPCDTKGLFVYGTLRYGSYNHFLLRGERNMPATTKGGLYLYRKGGGFPVLVPDDAGVVKGDYFPHLALNDVPEVYRMEVGCGYVVDRVEIRDEADELFTAWTFTWPHAHGPRVEDGDWISWEARNRRW